METWTYYAGKELSGMFGTEMPLDCAAHPELRRWNCRPEALASPRLEPRRRPAHLIAMG